MTQRTVVSRRSTAICRTLRERSGQSFDSPQLRPARSRRVLNSIVLCTGNAAVYHPAMIMKITQELADALHTSGDSELEVVDPQTQRRYVLIDSETHRRAMDALRREQDHEAIAEGLAQMEAGQGQPLDEAFADLRSRLGFPQPK